MQIIHVIKWILVLELFNIAGHVTLRSQLADRSAIILDGISWLVTIALGIWAGWIASKKIGYRASLAFKVAALLWIVVLMVPIVIWFIQAILDVDPVQELFATIGGYLVASIPVFFFIYFLVFIGRWIGRSR